MQSVEKPRYACAQWDYEAIEDNELTFKTGDYIEIVSTENEDWWEGILNGFQGFFPANRVEEVKNEELEIITESINSRRNTINQQELNVVTTPSDVNYGSPYTAEPSVSPLTATTTTSDAQQQSPVQYSDSPEFNMESLIESQLPENWKVEYDSSGRIYYKNTQTNEVTWELPVYNSKIVEYEEDLPEGWKAEYNNGNVYYYNIYTNETSWDKPKKPQGTFEVKYEESKETPDSYASESEPIRINLPPDKIKGSGKLLQMRYSKGSTKFSLKPCSFILCGGLLLFYKQIIGKLSENLPTGYVKLKNCSVDKASKNVTKKKYTLVINSEAGEEIILYCESESDVNSRIEIIKQCSEEDNDDSEIIDVLTRLSEKSENNSKKDKSKDKEKEKDVNKNKKNSQDDDKHKNKKFGKIFGNKKTESQTEVVNVDYLIFGGSLEEQVQKEGSTIPKVVEDCIREIEKRGIDTEGIYRLSGNTSVVNKLKNMYNKGEPIDFDDDNIDLPVMASLLKLYFRELKDTLIPSSMYDSFMEALKINEHKEKLYQLNDLLHQLPKVNFDVLAYLMKHLKKVAEKSEVNKMEFNNLAIVFGPTLISRSSDKETNALSLIADMPQQNRLIECIIMFEDWFFNDDENTN